MKVSHRVPGQLFWNRIAFNKFTTTFFILALTHCVTQVALEAFAFRVNTDALNLLESIYDLGNGSATAAGFAIFNSQNLTICKGIPDASGCQVVWNASAEADNAPSRTMSIPLMSTYLVQTTAVAAASAFPTLTVTTQVLPTTADFEPAVVVAVKPTPVIADAAPKATATKTVTLAVNPFRSAPVSAPQTVHDENDDSLDDLLQESLFKRDAGEVQGRAHVRGRSLRRIPAHVAAKRSLQREMQGGQFTGVLITDERLKGGEALASPACIMTLKIPIQTLRNTERVDLTFIAFQIWVLGMSVVALLNESIPHIIASFLTHALATGYAGYQLEMTQQFRAEFNRLIVQGPCGKNLVPALWESRRNAEISVAALNAVVLVALAYLSYKLIKAFGWQTFKRIGASLTINRIYRLVLAFSISIQLSVFFIGANIALWIDQLFNGNVAKYDANRKLFEGIYFTVLFALIPWLAMGWFAVRREHKFTMATFLIAAIAMISGWAMMFISRSFLWTFKSWDFFAAMTVTAAALLFATLGLGIACMLNFGRGLPRYLGAAPADEPHFEPASEKDPYRFDEEEKVEFPSTSPVPSFSVAFGSGVDVPPPSQMRFGPTRPAPGISMHARGQSEDIDFGYLASRPRDMPTRPPPAASLGRTPSASSASSYASDAHLPSHMAVQELERRTSASSNTSTGSANSSGSRGVRGPGGARRWIIE